MSKQNQIVIDLGNGRRLVASKNRALNEVGYHEIYVYLERDDGGFIQDLALIREAYQYEDGVLGPAPIRGKYQVLVYANEEVEDYTNEFMIGEYVEEDGV